MDAYVCPVCHKPMGDFVEYGKPVRCRNCGHKVMPDPRTSTPSSHPAPRDVAKSAQTKLIDLPKDLTTARSYKRDKRRVLLGLVWLVVAFGALSAIPLGDAARFVLTFGVGVVFAGLIVIWCGYDAAERQERLWRGFAFMVVLLPTPFVMVPLYLCATRGVRGLLSGAKAAIYFLGLCLASAVITVFCRHVLSLLAT